MRKFSLFIVTSVAVAFSVAQAKEPSRATDRLTAPIDKIEPTTPGSHIYELAMSKDDKLCRHMLKIFNDDLARYGYEQYTEHDEFKKIPWKEARFYSKSDGREDFREIQGALFDINNDGGQDFVAKWQASLGGILMDHLYILERQAVNRATHLTNRELFDSPNQIGLGGWVYTLGPPFQMKGDSFGVLEPFVFNDKTYIYMRPLFELAPAKEISISIVVRYGGGRLINRDLSGKMDDVCYFKRIRTDKQLPN